MLIFANRESGPRHFRKGSTVDAQQKKSELERAAEERHGSNLFADFWHFLRQNKKWWLVPLLVILLALSALMLLSTSGVAPFIYTLF